MTRLVVLLLLGFVALGCAPKGPAFRIPERDAGFVPNTFAQIHFRMQREALRGEITAASVTIHRRGRLVFRDHFGSVPLQGVDVPVDESTYFDIASLTKPLAGAPLAYSYLSSASIQPETAALVEAIIQGRTGVTDEVLLPYVSSLMGNPVMPLSQRHLLARIWSDRMETSLMLVGSPSWMYSNYAWASLPLLAYAHPELAPELNRWALRIERPGFVYRPLPTDVVAPSGFTSPGGLDFLQGRPHDPFADFLANAWRIPPPHSGFFATATTVGEIASGWLRDSETEGAFASWFFSPGPSLREGGDPTNISHQTYAGLRTATAPPYAPDNSRPGRYFHQDGYTGCLLWMDRQTGTVLVILTNASLDGTWDAWNRLQRDLVNFAMRGVVGD